MNANEAWIAVFRRIPENMHDGLTVGLRSGVEIAIQTILKLEPDFIIMRGRLTGTQEGGKILMMPYAEMTVLSIARPMKDTEVEAIFGKGELPAPIAPPPPVSETAVSLQANPEDMPKDASGAVKAPEQPTKNAMLAKFARAFETAAEAKMKCDRCSDFASNLIHPHPTGTPHSIRLTTGDSCCGLRRPSRSARRIAARSLRIS